MIPLDDEILPQPEPPFMGQAEAARLNALYSQQRKVYRILNPLALRSDSTADTKSFGAS